MLPRSQAPAEPRLPPRRPRLPFPPAVTSFYVDGSTGADTNNGSSAFPFAHIQKCVSTTTAGQACIVHAGVYGELVTPPNDGVTRMAAPGEQVTLSAADPVTGWTTAGNGIYTVSVSVPATSMVPMQNGHAQLFPGFQLFLNEAGVQQAQYPALSADPLHPNWATIATATPETKMVNGMPVAIPATITDPKAPALATPGGFIHIWSGSDPYEDYEGAVIAAPGGSISYANEGVFETNMATPGGLYYLVGSAAAAHRQYLGV